MSRSSRSDTLRYCRVSVNMGNMHCPAEDAAHLASIARDICPFPDYNPSPLFTDMLSVNSSLHLRDHYRTVQSSLTPKQLEDFTQDLRTTFGREGKVTLGGVGVVALSLAVLFDTLAAKARGDRVPDSGPIPGLFLEDLSGSYPPHVYTASEYLRLVPHIANNPTRMREETERYFKRIIKDMRTTEEDQSQRNVDIAEVQIAFGKLFENSLRIHLIRLTNSTVVRDIIKSVKVQSKSKDNPVPTEGPTESGVHVSKTRKKRIPAPETSVTFSLNCDPGPASITFLADLDKSNVTQEAFIRCRPSNRRLAKTLLHFIASLAWLDVINTEVFDFNHRRNLLINQREDFDLKADALRVWAE